MTSTLKKHEGKEQAPTYSRFINANIKGVYKVFQEHADQAEVESADAPGSINQDHDVRECLRAARKLIS